VGRFPEQFIQQIAQATDIVELIGQYVALKKKGKEFVGLCPFHEDKNPSMYVTPVKQIFKCFACGAGGGVYQFLMLYEKLTFPEAIKSLAQQAGIPLPAEAMSAPPQGGISKTDLLKVTSFAKDFFKAQLKSPSGKAALEYIRNRGLSEESLEKFELGYAPNSWDALLKAARRKNISENQLVTAGLAVRRPDSSGCYDRFRNRLIFPIYDVAGNVIAFGGRALAKDEQAKYLNSPETPLFDKSGNLYGLNFSRKAISTSGQAIVVEGYLDALMPQQAEIDNVVATLGTSLTDRHVRMLSRYAKEAVLVFDADTAGAAAAQRALEIFLAQRMHVRVATIPAGKDPCDFIIAEGADAFRKLMEQAPEALQYVWDLRLAEYQNAGGNLADRRRVVEDFLRLIVSSEIYGAIDGVRRGQLAQHLGPIIKISPIDLQQQMQRMARQIRKTSSGHQADNNQNVQNLGFLAERNILEVLLNEPEFFDTVAEKIDPEDFLDNKLSSIAHCIWQLGDKGMLSIEELLRQPQMAQNGAILTDIATEGEKRGNFAQTLNGAIENLLYRRDRLKLQELKAAPDEDDRLRQLNEHLRQADIRRHPKIN